MAELTVGVSASTLNFLLPCLAIDAEGIPELHVVVYCLDVGGMSEVLVTVYSLNAGRMPEIPVAVSASALR